jgi:hypothetical protein
VVIVRNKRVGVCVALGERAGAVRVRACVWHVREFQEYVCVTCRSVESGMCTCVQDSCGITFESVRQLGGVVCVASILWRGGRVVRTSWRC